MVDASELAARYMRLVDGFVTTQLLYVAASLDVGGRLSGGSKSGPDLAASLGVDCAALTRVLRGLVAEGVLDEDDHGRFALTPLGGCLSSLRGAAIARGALYYDAAAGLLKTVRDGGTSFEHVHGARFFEYLHRQPDQYGVFQRSMAGRASVRGRGDPPPERASDAPAVIRMDLLMLILLGARERTEAEFRNLLGAAGFAVQRVVRTGSSAGLGVIEAVAS